MRTSYRRGFAVSAFTTSIAAAVVLLPLMSESETTRARFVRVEPPGIAELGALASELTELSATVGKACAAGDIDALTELSERMLQVQVRYAERYRTMLVVRLRSPST